MGVNGHENQLKKHKKEMDAKQTLSTVCEGSGGFLSSLIKAIELLSGFIQCLYSTKVADNNREAGFSLQD